MDKKFAKPDIFLLPQNIIAIIGVSSDKDKYGYKVFFDLLTKGYNVYAVHQAGGEIDGHIRYSSLFDLPVKPDIVVTVVKPEITEQIIRQCVNLGINKIWMQPGSDSQQAIDLCHDNNINVIANACMMIKSV